MNAERAYVWEVPVRLTHWVNVLAILVLAGTGFYIGNPFISGSVYLMGWVRAIHRITAYTFAASRSTCSAPRTDSSRWRRP